MLIIIKTHRYVSKKNNNNFIIHIIAQKKSPGKPRKKASNVTSRRAEQNRSAQRAFRERKEKYVTDLEKKVEELEKRAGGGSVSRLERENEELKKYIVELQEEINRLGGRTLVLGTSVLGTSVLGVS